MTRITKMAKKTHEEASGFTAVSLLPKAAPIDTKLDKKHRFKKELSTFPKQKSNSVPRRDRKLQCFNCRKTGHTIQRCPLAKTLLKCYICGSTEHSITRCLKPKDPLNPFPFASCFICQETGHISGHCPQNERGVYPKGGSCVHCDSVRHLAKDCDKKDVERKKTGEIELGVIDLKQGADDDDVHIVLQETRATIHEERIRRANNPHNIKKTNKVVNF